MDGADVTHIGVVPRAPSEVASRQTRIFVGLLLLAGLVLPIRIGESLLIGHLFLAVIIAIWVGSNALFGRSRFSGRDALQFKMLLVLTTCLACAVLAFGTGARFTEESTKLALLLVGSLAISAVMGASLWRLLPLAAIGLGLNVLYTWRSNPDAFTYGGRLELEGLGSPNSLAFLIAIVILILVLTPDALPWLPLFSIARWPLVIVLAFIMLQSASRGGLFSLVAGLIAGVVFARSARGRSRRLSVLLGILFSAYASFYVLSSSGFADQLLARLNLTTENSTSGRTAIWRSLIEQQLASDRALIFGFGPGSIDVGLFNKVIVSAHSLVLTMSFYFGLIGLLAFVIFWAVTWRAAMQATDPRAELRLSLVACLSLSFVVDNTALSTQALLTAAIAIAATGIVPEATQDPPGPTIKPLRRRLAQRQ